MPRLHETITTALPADDAFAFVADFANARHWDPGVAASERIDDAPVGVGARYRLEVRMRGRTAPMEYRIATYEPSRRVVLTGEGSGVAAVDDIRFAPTADGGTRIEYIADIRLQGLLRLATPFAGKAFAAIARNARDGMQRTLDRMAAEQRPAAVAG